jgi:hypothetical protein
VRFNCGPEPVTITLTSEKAITAATTIDGGGLITLSGGGAVRIFTVDDWSTALEVRNLTIADGHAQSSGEWPFGIGGGIYNAGALTLTNCVLSDNSEGGIANNGTLTLTNCTLSGNTAGVDRGGGIYNWGTATLTNCTLSGNAAGVGGGGALFNHDTASLTNCTLSENARGPGVAIVSYLFCTLGCSGGPLTLTNTIITESAGKGAAHPG